MRCRIPRFELRRLLQRISRFVITLQTTVRIAEILVSIGTDLIALLKAELVSLTGFAEQFDRLLARRYSILITTAMVVRKTQIVVDLGNRRVELQRLLINLNRLRIPIQAGQRKRQWQVRARVVRLHFDRLLISVDCLLEFALVHVNVSEDRKSKRLNSSHIPL